MQSGIVFLLSFIFASHLAAEPQANALDVKHNSGPRGWDNRRACHKSSSSSSSEVDPCADCHCNGPRGPRGENGATGPIGIKGLTGAAGRNGRNGTVVSGASVFYGKVENNNPPGSFAVGIPVRLNFTTGSNVYGPDLQWEYEGVTVGPEGTGTYLCYYQVIPIYPLKMYLAINGSPAPINTAFGKDMDSTLGTTGGYNSDYYAGQAIIYLNAGDLVEFFVWGTSFMELEDYGEDSLPMSLVMIKLGTQVAPSPP